MALHQTKTLSEPYEYRVTKDDYSQEFASATHPPPSTQKSERSHLFLRSEANHPDSYKSDFAKRMREYKKKYPDKKDKDA